VPVYEEPRPARAVAQPRQVVAAAPSEADAIARLAHDPAKLRHAIVLNEILSPPLALRKPGESPFGPSF
jgi:hypothetical protein